METLQQEDQEDEKRPRRRRGRSTNKLDPDAGWVLIRDTAVKFRFLQGLKGYLALRAFAVALQQLFPHLTVQARPEQLRGDTLLVRVNNSSAAAELRAKAALLLQKVGEQLAHLLHPVNLAAWRKVDRVAVASQRAPKTIRQIQFMVGAVDQLPDVMDDGGYQARAPAEFRGARPPPNVRIDGVVAQELCNVQDAALRRALSALYFSSLQGARVGEQKTSGSM